MTVTVFVAGGNSQTGSATIFALLRDHPNVNIRAGVRDIKKTKEKFVNCDFKRLQFVQHEVKNKHLTPMQTAEADAKELKGVDTLMLVPPQGNDDRIGMTMAYTAAAKAAGVKLIVMISSPAISKPNLILSKELAVCEQFVASCGVPYTFLRCVFFYENLWGSKQMLSPTDGSATFSQPIKGDVPIQHVAVYDIGEAAANLLAGTCNGQDQSAGVDGCVQAHGGKAYWIGGPALSHNSMAIVFSRVLNKPVAFKSATDDAAIKGLQGMGWPELNARGFCELYRYFEHGGFPENTNDLQMLLNDRRCPMTLSQWMIRSDAALAFGGVKQTIFVAGASGNCGSATVKALLHDHPNVYIRAGVRDSKKAETVFASEFADKTLKAQDRLKFALHDVKSNHLTLIPTDEADVSEFKGIDTLILVPPQATEDRVAFTRTYLKAAKGAGVKHVVALSSPGVSQPKLLLMSGLAAMEDEITKSGLAYTFCRAVFFYENFLGQADTIRGHGAFYAPVSNEAKMPGIATRDIGEAMANVATWGGGAGANRKGHWGKTYVLCGEAQTYPMQADTFTKVTGKPVRFVSVTDDQCLQSLKGKGFPDLIARGFVELYHGFESGRIVGAGAPDQRPLQSLLNEQRPPTRLEQWIKPLSKTFTQQPAHV